MTFAKLNCKCEIMDSDSEHEIPEDTSEMDESEIMEMVDETIPTRKSNTQQKLCKYLNEVKILSFYV